MVKKAKNNEKDKNIEVIKKTTDKLFEMIGVTPSSEVTFDKENDIYLLNISAGEEAGLLIGKKGETINAIQVLINQVLRQKNGEWVRVVVDVADFREKEKSRMEELALQTAARVRETGEAQSLYNLTPSQRRMVHMALSSEDGMKTESVGEGKDRYLVVALK